MRVVRYLVLLCCLSCHSVFAQIDAPAVLVPAGLNPGDEFFVIFASSSTANLCKQVPSSPALSPMDDTAAINLANLAATTGSRTSSVAGWQALYIHERGDALGVITDTVAASGVAFNNNITQPIYNTRGELIANNHADLFDGSSFGSGTQLINPIMYDEDGNTFNTGDFAYTGFDELGARVVGRTLGYGGTGCAVGEPDRTNGLWANSANSNNVRSIYVLSPLMRVPASSSSATAVPVAPQGFALILGLLMIVGVRRKLNK